MTSAFQYLNNRQIKEKVMKSSLETWDPIREMGGLQRRLSTMFSGEGGELLSVSDDADWMPAVDVTEDDQHYTITADLPEVSKQDAKVTIKDGVLTLSGERKREMEQADTKYHRIERSYGKYQRSFHVPDTVEPASIDATFKDGVLTIIMPKRVTPEQEAQEIEVH